MDVCILINQDNITKNIGEHAIVIGNSIAGLLAGRVLATHFKKVTIIEKTLINDDPYFIPRSSVPQGGGHHFILSKGTTIIEKLFPKFEQTLKANGGHREDLINDVSYYRGGWMPRFPSNLFTYSISRPVLEHTIRTLLSEYQNVFFLYEKEVKGFLTNNDRNSIVGVHIQDTNNNEEVNIYGDLIVDASGRNTVAYNWLEALGFKKPYKSEVNLNISYISQAFRCPTSFHDKDWKSLRISNNPPFSKKTGSLSRIENDKEGGEQLLVTLAGHHIQTPINSNEGFLDFARQLDSPLLYEIIKDAKPLGPCMPFKMQFARRFYYEDINVPLGFIAIGDALCTLNSINGQGITMCAIEATILDTILANHTNSNYLANLKEKYFKEVGKVLNPIWYSGSIQECNYPEYNGKHPFGANFFNGYFALIVKIARKNPKVFKKIVEVLNLEKSFITFFSPYILIQVVRNFFVKD